VCDFRLSGKAASPWRSFPDLLPRELHSGKDSPSATSPSRGALSQTLFPKSCTRGRIPRVQLVFPRVHLTPGEDPVSRSGCLKNRTISSNRRRSTASRSVFLLFRKQNIFSDRVWSKTETLTSCDFPRAKRVARGSQSVSVTSISFGNLTLCLLLYYSFTSV
jgi:hypothetical protein